MFVFKPCHSYIFSLHLSGTVCVNELASFCTFVNNGNCMLSQYPMTL